jgi:hypothetical protein
MGQNRPAHCHITATTANPNTTEVRHAALATVKERLDQLGLAGWLHPRPDRDEQLMSVARLNAANRAALVLIGLVLVAVSPC